MATIHFITSNEDKFREAKNVLSDLCELKMLDLDLPEVQSLNSEVIISAKLKAAFEHHSGPLMVEDVGLYLDCLHGFPGSLIKWFLQSVGNEGIYQLISLYGNDLAEVRAIIGYATDVGSFHYFEGKVKGKIVSPLGKGWGFDPIFVPQGFDETYGQMGEDEKNKISHRRKALDALRSYLDRQ